MAQLPTEAGRAPRNVFSEQFLRNAHANVVHHQVRTQQQPLVNRQHSRTHVCVCIHRYRQALLRKQDKLDRDASPARIL